MGKRRELDFGNLQPYLPADERPVLLKGAYDDLVNFPPLKPVMVVDWGEEDGVEADLDAPRLAAQEVEVPLLMPERTSEVAVSMRELVDDLRREPRVVGWFPAVRRRVELRFLEVGRHEKSSVLYDRQDRDLKGHRVVSLRFSQDSPWGAEFSLPSDVPPEPPPLSERWGKFTAFNGRDVTLDGRELRGYYGVALLQGWATALGRTPPLKPSVLVDARGEHGVEALGEMRGVYGTFEAELRCLMRARDLMVLWTNRDELLRALTEPGLRRLRFADAGGEGIWDFYYKQCRTEVFFPEGKLWWEFVLTVVVVKSVHQRLKYRAGYRKDLR